MAKALLLRLHRWVFIFFAIPLAVIIVTGLILSFQPILQTAGIKPGSIKLEQIEGYLAKHDPHGKARSVRVDHFEKTFHIQGQGVSANIDLATGGEVGATNWITKLISWSRPVHEHFVFDLERLTGVPIVLASTIGMVFAMFLGALMGIPRIMNSVAGWHKATAWALLPLLILSPLTGAFMALRITFSEQTGRVEAASILDAMRMLAQKHDLSGLNSIRPRGGRQLAMMTEGNSRFTYIVAKDGVTEAPSNWPRVLHQGDFFGIWGGIINLVLSVAFILLLSTGLWIWGRRNFKRWRRLSPAPAE